jgi:hypothetical protein
MNTPSRVAIVIRGSAADAAVTVRGIRTMPAGTPFEVYLVLDGTAVTEALNRAVAVRTEDLILFLDAGLTPVEPNWLKRMVHACDQENVGAAVGTTLDESDTAFAGLMTRREVFDLLGGLDADRHPTNGYQDYLTRLIGLGYECVAPGQVEFLAGSAQLKRAG